MLSSEEFKTGGGPLVPRFWRSDLMGRGGVVPVFLVAVRRVLGRFAIWDS